MGPQPNPTATISTWLLFVLSDSVSQETFRASGIDVDRCGKVVCVSIARSFSISDAWGTASVCTLPNGFRPRRTITAATTLQESGSNDVTVVLTASGDVYVQGKGTSWRSGWLFCTASFIAA